MWSQVGLRKHRLQTKLVEVTEFQMSYFKSKRWCCQSQFSSVQFSHTVVSYSLQPHGSQHARPPSPNPGVYQTHVHWVSDAIQPSHPLSSPSRPAFNLSQHQGLFQWVSSLHQVAKLLELSRYWTQYASKFGKLSHGHRTGKGQFSFQSQGKAMLKNVQTVTQLHLFHTLAFTGEGNGDPLQCSCLENPRDGGAWWAAIYGIRQSRTRLKRLSSSSSSSKVMLKILQARLQWYVNCELPDVQTGFRKGRGTRD